MNVKMIIVFAVAFVLAMLPQTASVAGPAYFKMSKTWTLNCVAGIPQTISSVVCVTRPVTKISDVTLVPSTSEINAHAELVPSDPFMVRICFTYRARKIAGTRYEEIDVCDPKGAGNVLGNLQIVAKVKVLKSGE